MQGSSHVVFVMVGRMKVYRGLDIGVMRGERGAKRDEEGDREDG